MCPPLIYPWGPLPRLTDEDEHLTNETFRLVVHRHVLLAFERRDPAIRKRFVYRPCCIPVQLRPFATGGSIASTTDITSPTPFSRADVRSR